MSSSGGSSHSGASRPIPEFLSGSLGSGKVSTQDNSGPKTVIRTESRQGGSSIHGEGPAQSIWRRLFPAELDQSDQGVAGIRFDHFIVESRIGAGGMGSVFKATDERLKRSVALKVLTSDTTGDPATVSRFQNEACSAARLDHENIARVFYVGEDHGLPFIAYEYVTGNNIRELIQEHGRLDPADAVNYTLQIAWALNHTDANGVVHRDIKPSNIIITPQGRAKLVDLGLARKKSTDSVGDLTVAGTTLGTFDYISPEQAKDPRNVDVRSDIYSLGCTLYHMLTGEPPYPEGTVLQKLLDHQGKQAPDPAKRNRQVPPQLSHIVRKMMASDPKSRYATPDLLIRDLMQVVRAMGLRGVNPEGLVWHSGRDEGLRFWEKHLGWMATAGALLLIVLLLERFPSIGADTPGTAPSNMAEQKADSGPRNPYAAGNVEKSGDELTQPVPDIDQPGSVAPVGNNPPTVSGNPKASKAEKGNDQPPSAVGTNTRPSENANVQSNENVVNAAPNDPPDNASAGGTTTASEAEKGQDNSPATDKDNGPGTTVARTAPPATTETTEPPELKNPLPEATVENLPAIAVLDTNGEAAPSPYPTLEAACNDAKDGDIIELRYNGRRSTSEKPIRIANKKITIRAAKDYRPTITFRREPNDSPDSFDVRFIQLENASVALINIDLDITVDESVPLAEGDQWALFFTNGGHSIRLQGVSIALNNTSARPAALFDLGSTLGGDVSKIDLAPGMGDGKIESSRAAEISIEKSFIRSISDGFSVKTAIPVSIDMRNSLVVLEESLVNLTGNDESPGDAILKLTLEDLTCVTGEGLIALDSGRMPSRDLLKINVAARNNIFSTNTTHELMKLRGSDMQDLRRQVVWQGQNNYYDQFETFRMMIVGQDTTESVETEELDFTDFVAEYDVNGSRRGMIQWKTSWLIDELIKVQPTDFTLFTREEFPNPAIEGATDGSDAGADLEYIPNIPASVNRRGEETTARSATPRHLP